MGRGFRQIDPAALKQLIDESGVYYRENKRSFIFTCPRCDKSQKLMMFKEDGRFICWVCAETSGFKGRAEYALTEIVGLSIRDVQARIYGAGFEREPIDVLNLNFVDFFDETPPEDLQPPPVMQWPLDFYPLDHDFSKRGREYLEGRNISTDLAMQYGVRYCPVQRRVIFPTIVAGQLRGWQARIITNDLTWEDEDGKTHTTPKVLTTGPRDTVLMFQDRLAGSNHAVICEGPVDGIKAHLVGGNVVTMGKVVSRTQLQLIRNAGVTKLFLALDPDAATETMRLAQAMGDLDCYHLTPAPGFKDLGDMTCEAVAERAEKAEAIRPGMLLLHFEELARHSGQP